jgi:hypothetical protein
MITQIFPQGPSDFFHYRSCDCSWIAMLHACTNIRCY